MTPCPFCAGEPRWTYTGAGRKRRYYVVCVGCKAKTGEFKTKEGSGAAWERRAK